MAVGPAVSSPHSMEDLEKSLGNITMAPYIVKAMALIGVRRWAGSNMFRHQISTMGILLDYKIVDPVLLKASVIHDLFENAANMPGVTEADIVRIDADGPAVYALVMEVTIRIVNGTSQSSVTSSGSRSGSGRPSASSRTFSPRRSP